MKEKPDAFPEQPQAGQPGEEHKMHPQPEYIRKNYKGSGKLEGKKAVITGGDSGIGRAVAVHFAREGADVAIVYTPKEEEDAQETRRLVEEEGRTCLLFQGDVKDEKFCRKVIVQTIEKFNDLHVLVNNAAVQFPKNEPEDVSAEQFRLTFETNIFPYHYFTHEALKYMREGASIINTSSITAYRGSGHLIDYASTKGAIIAYSRSLAKMLAEKGIRVNAVAPGPIWTPLIPSSFESVEKFGQKTAMGRAGQPSEVGPSYVLLAGEDGSYMTGQTIHINGGEFMSS